MSRKTYEDRPSATSASADVRLRSGGERAEIFIDGACLGNPGPAGIGVVIKDGGKDPIRELSKFIGETTNNVAEYLALVYALQEALLLGYEKVSVKSDSELLVKQLDGSYKVRQPNLRLFHDLAVHLRRGFKDCSIEHIPRSKNAHADALAGKGARRAAK